MENTPLCFELPENLAVEKFMLKLAKKCSTELILQQYALKTFYDSFDWRLYNAQLLCEFNQSKSRSHLEVKNFQTNQLVASIELEEVPRFPADFTEISALKKIFEPLLDMRALLSITTLDVQIYCLNILNKDQKTIARLFIEEYELIKNRVSIQTLKGYDKSAIKLSQLLSEFFNLNALTKPILVPALKIQGRKPKDYSSKLALKLEPNMRADEASKIIYKQLLKTIKVNEQGTMDDIDSEFLHDFRVAIRRTRAGLGQLKNVLPAKQVQRYSEYFAWLGQITGLTRDLDVYLLSFEDYKRSLPASMQENLNPLQDFLYLKQSIAQKELAQHLKSKKYRTSLTDWEKYLKQAVDKKPAENSATLNIKALADLRIWKTYQKVLNEGNAIDDNSPAIALHDLRKTCKKLRYLMEFFQSLYSEADIKTLIKALKGFQEILGDFQDFEVQEQTLKLFSEEMLQAIAPPSSHTFLAMGILVQQLDYKRLQAREQFSGRFTHFKETQYQSLFESLFVANA